MTVFTAQTNLAVCTMAPLQLQDLWLQHMKIYLNTIIKWVPTVYFLKHCDKVKSAKKKNLVTA